METLTLVPLSNPADDPELVELVDFVQHVAASRNAACKADHHAGTCRGAVGLAESAARVLGNLGIELRTPRESFTKPCFLCGDDSYVIGKVSLGRWVHAKCLSDYEARTALQEKPCCFCGASATSTEPCPISPDTRHFTVGEAASTIEAGAWENQRLRDVLSDHGIEP